MAQTCADWLESQADRAFARQRAQVDTAKLLGTFAAGIAATLVATALQVGTPERLDRIAAYILVGAVVGAICVILLDRITEADHAKILELSQLKKWDEDKLMEELRVATIKAVHNNGSVVNSIRWTLSLQVASSAAAGVTATLSLLG
jgi:uncharacterized membrane protein YeaQ/YmgE (transglycosylase-associated protein family)